MTNAILIASLVVFYITVSWSAPSSRPMKRAGHPTIGTCTPCNGRVHGQPQKELKNLAKQVLIRLRSDVNEVYRHLTHCDGALKKYNLNQCCGFPSVIHKVDLSELNTRQLLSYSKVLISDVKVAQTSSSKNSSPPCFFNLDQAKLGQMLSDIDDAMCDLDAVNQQEPFSNRDDCTFPSFHSQCERQSLTCNFKVSVDFMKSAGVILDSVLKVE